MKKLTAGVMKNRTVIGIICIVLAVVLVFGVSPLINKISNGKISVVRTTRDIKQGEMIRQEDIEIVEIGKLNQQSDIITNKELVIGKYAAMDIPANDNILSSKIRTESYSAKNVYNELNGEKQVLSVTLSNLAAGLSAKLQSGDIVSAIIIEDKNTRIPAELKYLKVIAATTGKGIDTDEQNQAETKELPSTVTLLVNERQATMLARYDSQVYFSLVYRGNAETGNQFLKAQDDYFAGLEKKEEGEQDGEDHSIMG